MINRLTIILLMIAASILIFACSSNNSNGNRSEKEDNNIDNTKVSYVYQNDAKFDALNKKGAKIVKISEVALGSKLKKAIAEGGLEYAIDFCNLEAMKITDSLSKAQGVTIKRIAQKNRNPQNKANETEAKIFKHYVMDYLTGKPLKPRMAINDNNNPVYYRPIITNNMCLSCHGTPNETIPPELFRKINEKYPEDKAIDFKAGHPRGMWAITYNNIKVNK